MSFATYRVNDYDLQIQHNEAVELAKTFGGTDGYKYINGVLDKVATQARPTEIRPR